MEWSISRHILRRMIIQMMARRISFIIIDTLRKIELSTLTPDSPIYSEKMRKLNLTNRRRSKSQKEKRPKRIKRAKNEHKILFSDSNFQF
jgi:hypothetical protein